jgi:dipeptidyl aminopeptidase
MNKRNGYREVYEWMTDFLIEKWGRGPIIRHA